MPKAGKAPARRVRELRRALGAEIRQLRSDAGIRQVLLAREAGLSRSHLCAIEAGSAEASQAALIRIGEVLGCDLSIRLFPGTGPRIRDHLQTRILEALLRGLHPRWKRFLEVPVYRPAKGVIDAVLHDPREHRLVAVEVHSELRRLEQLVRWSHQKRDSLRSADLWTFASAEQVPAVSGLLVVRSTSATRAVIGQLPTVVVAEFPAATAAVYASLSGPAAWPGDAILWASVDGSGARILDRPPRGVAVGR